MENNIIDSCFSCGLDFSKDIALVFLRIGMGSLYIWLCSKEFYINKHEHYFSNFISITIFVQLISSIFLLIGYQVKINAMILAFMLLIQFFSLQRKESFKIVETLIV